MQVSQGFREDHASVEDIEVLDHMQVVFKSEDRQDPHGNGRAWTFGRLPEDKEWNAEAVMRVGGSIWNEVRAEDHCRPNHHSICRQATSKTGTYDAVPGETQGHRAVWVHARLQAMPSSKSKSQAAGSHRNVLNANIG